ncbi:YitT family protein [Floccifex sp.]|uniref:YitT family protein n=1 Tax=Floccifex sp. TaxID=2815810 RepID=UPI002A76578D|nr:YitT family protein [Floccifex sp.]MDD7281004.1 YitT family protein [Erysipelotrichaceae bacterium]MDY2959103.1 YitT family protein [Floccifex sp.]
MEKNEIYKYAQLVFGSILFALSVNMFVTPNSINTGGIVGIAQLFDYYIPHSASFDLTGIMNAILNIPLFILAVRTISKRFCIKTLISVMVQTLTLSLLPKVASPVMEDLLSNCLIGAIMGGIGIGFCLRSSGCAGGMDILGVYFSKTRPGFSVGKLSIMLNAVLFTFCAFEWSLESSLYSIIYVAVMYFVCDRIHYQNINIAATIFTKKEELKQEIMSRTGRGVTYWNGKGAYTDSDLFVLVTCLNKYEIRTLKKIIEEVDPDAFVILNEGSNISGGFEKRL